jgi:hypothetical protein
MFTDILKKYMNVFIIILYVYILYSYDFKDNTQLLLVITGIFIYIIYRNKGNAFTNDIIEGNTNSGDGGAGDGAGGGGAGGAGDGAAGDAAGDAVAAAAAATDQLYVVDGGDDGSRTRLLELLNELRSELESMDENTVDSTDPRVDELLRLYVEIYPNLEVNLPNILNGASGDLPTPEIALGNLPLNLNLDLGGLESVNIPSDLTNNYNDTEVPKLKKRLRYLEEKVKELDEEDNVQGLKEKVMDLEIENDKWNQMGEESEEGDKNLKQRKVRSFSNYKTTTPMGMYDGMCLDHLKKENIYKLANEGEVNTFLGTSLPLKIKDADNSKLNGPSVDGNDSSPKRLNIFETNKTSISCCENSPYLSSNGCVCLTSDQEDYLVNRGGNHG